MRIEEISAHEADFDANHKDSNGKNFDYAVQSIQIPGESIRMEYINLNLAQVIIPIILIPI